MGRHRPANKSERRDLKVTSTTQEEAARFLWHMGWSSTWSRPPSSFGDLQALRIFFLCILRSLTVFVPSPPLSPALRFLDEPSVIAADPLARFAARDRHGGWFKGLDIKRLNMANHCSTNWLIDPSRFPSPYVSCPHLGASKSK